MNRAPQRVQVAALSALLGLGGQQRSVFGVVYVGGDTDRIDDVSGAFVIDQAARPELADGQEAGPLKKLWIASPSTSASRYER